MDMQAYFSFLRELRQALDSMAKVEQKKLQAIQKGDLEALEQCMKQEQVASLDLRGREQKRTALLKELGLEKVPLRQLADHCPAEYKGQAREISQQVLRSYEVLSSAQQAARTLMESDLRKIQRVLERREADRQQSAAPGKTQTDFRV